MLKKMFILWIVGASAFSLPSIAVKNHPPDKPTLTGPSSGEAGKSYTYTIVSTDPDEDKIYYCFDWGDGEEFCGDLMNSGEEMQATHSWKDKGSYTIKVTATDEHGAHIATRAPFEWAWDIDYNDKKVKDEGLTEIIAKGYDSEYNEVSDNVLLVYRVRM